MIGDQADFVSRLRAVIPARWFPDTSPVLTGLLNGKAWVWAQLYTMLMFVRDCARTSTASGVFLDMIARDFFGQAMLRGSMSDSAMRAAILRRITRAGGTRAGMAAELLALTTHAPAICEPWRPADCGAWHGGPIAIGYGLAGAWGSLRPAQTFIAVNPGAATDDQIYGSVFDMHPAGVQAWVSIS